MLSQQPIFNQQRELSSRKNNLNRYNNKRYNSNNETKQNRSDFRRNRNNNQTNQTSSYPIHNNSNQIDTKQNSSNASIVCYKCNKLGHYSNNCTKPTNRNQPRIYSNQTNNQIQQQQQPIQQSNPQTNNNQTHQQQLNSKLNHQTNTSSSFRPNTLPLIPINVKQRKEQRSRNASPNNRLTPQTHSIFNFHQQITVECEINNISTTFIADTGWQHSIINKNTIDLNNNEWGHIKPFNINVFTAEGQKAKIIGIKQCKIQIERWTGL
jgi:hypothetical protein